MNLHYWDRCYAVTWKMTFRQIIFSNALTFSSTTNNKDDLSLKILFFLCKICYECLGMNELNVSTTWNPIEILPEISLTVQKMRFSIKDFFSKCDQIRRKLGNWPHLLKKSLMENFIFCAVVNFILPEAVKFKPQSQKSLFYLAFSSFLVL